MCVGDELRGSQLERQLQQQITITLAGPHLWPVGSIERWKPPTQPTVHEILSTVIRTGNRSRGKLLHLYDMYLYKCYM